ncbi:MAG TPA: hypothetical protein VN283_05610, partial [Thiobacillus sp.]|nr:hypothetical protein [Thiobacillus sp.]
MKHLNKALLVSLLASNLAVGQEATSIEAETVGRLVAEAINSDAQFKISQLENSRALKSAVSKFRT